VNQPVDEAAKQQK